MNSEQQIRATAAQATASLMCGNPPPPGDFVAMAGVIEAYIREGRGAALALCSGLADQPQPEPIPEAPVAPPVEPHPALTPTPSGRPEPVPEIEDVTPGRDAEIIPLAARGQVSPKQEEARRFIEKKRREKVNSLVSQAEVAKAKAHKQRLMDEAEENQLLDYTIAVKGEATTLGAYLGSLLGS